MSLSAHREIFLLRETRITIGHGGEAGIAASSFMTSGLNGYLNLGQLRCPIAIAQCF
jgi:hypothetical protein